MERTLGVSKAEQNNVRGSLVERGGLSGLGGVMGTMKGTMSTYGSKFGSGMKHGAQSVGHFLLSKSFAKWMIVVSVILFFYLRHVQKKGPGKRELESADKAQRQIQSGPPESTGGYGGPAGGGSMGGPPGGSSYGGPAGGGSYGGPAGGSYGGPAGGGSYGGPA